MPRTPFSRTQRMAVPRSRIWSLLESPGHLELCHPLVVRNEAETWPGPGARDTVVYHSGYVLHRHVTEWIEGIGYDIRIHDPRGRNECSVTWRIHEHGPMASSLTISLAPDRFRDSEGLTGLLTWLPYHVGMRCMNLWYLSHIQRGIDYHLSTGHRVTRNQFGPFPVFSPPQR